MKAVLVLFFVIMVTSLVWGQPKRLKDVMKERADALRRAEQLERKSARNSPNGPNPKKFQTPTLTPTSTTTMVSDNSSDTVKKGKEKEKVGSGKAWGVDRDKPGKANGRSKKLLDTQYDPSQNLDEEEVETIFGDYVEFSQKKYKGKISLFLLFFSILSVS